MIKLLLFLIPLYSFTINAQNAINVLESTIKIGALDEQEFYMGFAEGDRLTFDFREVNGKDLKEIEITEWPSAVKFADFKVSRVERKTLEIPRTSIYRFRFQNSAITGRICKILIQRIPVDTKTQLFNTNVYWRIVNDTSYSPTTERYLEKSDTTIINVIEQNATVSSQTALNGNINSILVDFDLPPGTAFWSYYIGVGREGQQAFDAARDKFTASAARQVSKLEGYGTMAALAIYGLNLFAQVQGQNNVKYWFIPDSNNVRLFQSRQAFQTTKQGDVINDAARMTTPLKGKVYLGLVNDNLIEAIDVIIRVTAVKVDQIWGARLIQKMNITQRNEAYLK